MTILAKLKMHSPYIGYAKALKSWSIISNARMSGHVFFCELMLSASQRILSRYLLLDHAPLEELESSALNLYGHSTYNNLKHGAERLHHVSSNYRIWQRIRLAEKLCCSSGKNIDSGETTANDNTPTMHGARKSSSGGLLNSVQINVPFDKFCVRVTKINEN